MRARCPTKGFFVGYLIRQPSAATFPKGEGKIKALRSKPSPLGKVAFAKQMTDEVIRKGPLSTGKRRAPQKVNTCIFHRR